MDRPHDFVRLLRISQQDLAEKSLGHLSSTDKVVYRDCAQGS